MPGRRGAREVVDLVDLEEQRVRDVVPDELEVRPAQEVLDVLLPARKKVVQTDHLFPALEQGLAQVRAQESGGTGDDDHRSKVEVKVQELSVNDGCSSEMNNCSLALTERMPVAAAFSSR